MSCLKKSLVVASSALSIWLGSVTSVFAQSVPPGYYQLARGIYGRWCTDCVDPNNVVGDSYVGMEVWCKDVPCGTIHAYVNFQKNGVTVDNTADTMTLGKGERGILVFESFRSDLTGYSLAEFANFPF